MKKLCVLEDKPCTDCGECDICDLDKAKRCDSCGKCIDNQGDYRSIEIEDILFS